MIANPFIAPRGRRIARLLPGGRECWYSLELFITRVPSDLSGARCIPLPWKPSKIRPTG